MYIYYFFALGTTGNPLSFPLSLTPIKTEILVLCNHTIIIN